MDTGPAPALRQCDIAKQALALKRQQPELPDGLTPALNTEQAAVYTGLAEKTLEGLRCRRGGPRFVRYGRKAVRYLVSDLDEWMHSRVVGSTSEPLANTPRFLVA